MKRLSILLLLSVLSAFAVAQDNPPAPRPGGARGPGRAGRQFQGVLGTITSLDKSQLTLKTADGKTVTVNLSSDTHYRKDAQPATLEDFKVGDMVMVGGEPAGEDAWNARFIATRGANSPQVRGELGKNFIAGEIKTIDGTRLAILRPDGETQTIQVDENTSFRKQGESITLADFKPGDHVFGRGELKNGAFVPAVLSAGDFQQTPPARPTPQPHSEAPSDKH